MCFSLLSLLFQSAPPKQRHGFRAKRLNTLNAMCEKRSDFLKDLETDDLLACYASRVPSWHCYLAVI